jgi:peroxiredoxin Q/BCP
LAVLRDAGSVVVGVSPDAPARLREFRTAHDLPFTLLSDPEHRVLTAYGAWGEKKLYGKTVTGVIRSTVVIDDRGVVEHAFYNVKATGHVAKLLRDLELAG